MFGYVQPDKGELRLREYEMYRALYCGLCHAMGENTGELSRFTLNYDFVFLCAFRAAVLGVPLTVEEKPCILYPVRKHPTVNGNEVLTYCSYTSALLTHEKILDDRTDERGIKLLAATLASPFSARAVKKTKNLEKLQETVREHLRTLSELEKNGCSSLDETSLCFGRLLGEIFAYGLTGTEERISRVVGQSVGQCVYILDAADDLVKDEQKGRYNPILLRYGRENLVERENFWDKKTKKKMRLWLNEDVAKQIFSAFCTTAKQGASACELLDYSNTSPEVEEIVKNILYLGLPAMARKILNLRKD